MSAASSLVWIASPGAIGVLWMLFRPHAPEPQAVAAYAGRRGLRANLRLLHERREPSLAFEIRLLPLRD